MKIEQGKKYYKVRWKNYPPEYDTWEPEEGLDTIPLLLNKFHREY